MSVRVSPHLSPRRQAEEVANANYEALKEVVLRSVGGRLSARSIRLDRIDLEAAYNQAWHGVCEAIAQGRRVENLAGLLVDITGKRAIDIYRQRNEALHSDAEVEEQCVEVDFAERVDDQRKLERLLGRLKERLTDVQRNAVTLCVLQGYTRPEAARILGIEAAAFEKVMDRTMKKLGGIIAAMDSRGCGDDEWARALRSFALGAIGEDSPDFERVAEHVRECASCERYVMGLRGLGAVLPPLGLSLASVGRDAGGPLAYLHRLFTPHGAVGAAAGLGSQTAATVGSGAAAGSAAGGGGWIVLGSGAAKVAVVVGLATVGTLSVAAVVAHQHPSRQPRVAMSRPSSSGGPLPARDDLLPAAPTPPQGATSGDPGQRANGVKQRARRVARVVPSGTVVAEFGLQRARLAETPARVVRRVVVAAPAPSARAARAGSAELREFNFER